MIDIYISEGTGALPYTVSYTGPEWNYSSWDQGYYGSAEPGMYDITVSDANGCQWNTTIEIQEPELLEISATTIDYSGYGVSCNGASDGEIAIDVTGGWDWSYTMINWESDNGSSGN